MWPLLHKQGGGFGGGETEMWTLMRGLAARRGVRVSLLTAADVPAETVIETIEVAGVAEPLITSDNSRFFRVIALIRYGLSTGWSIHQSRADVIFLKLPSFEMFAVAAAGWVLRTPVVFRVVSNWEVDEHNLAALIFHGSQHKARLFRFCLRHFHCVVCQTQHQRAELKRNFGVDAVLIPNVHELPINIASFNERDGVPWVGRAHPGKHPNVFLELAEANRDVAHTMIMAPAQEFSKLSGDVVDAASAQTNVHFHPGLPSGEVMKFFGRARVFALTSEAEGFSNVVIEALKYGVPVVSLWWNPDGLFQPLGDCDVSDCEAALGFVANGSLSAAASMIQRLHDDTVFWQACSQRAVDYVKNTHSPDMVLPRYEALFSKIAQ